MGEACLPHARYTELEYMRHGGVLPMVLRQLIAAKAS